MEGGANTWQELELCLDDPSYCGIDPAAVADAVGSVWVATTAGAAQKPIAQPIESDLDSQALNEGRR